MAELPAPHPHVPPYAPNASTGRIPHTRVEALRRSTAALARRLTHRHAGAVADTATPGESSRWRLWTELGLSYLALLLSRLPRPTRPARTFRVFTVPLPPTATATVTAPDGAPRPRR